MKSVKTRSKDVLRGSVVTGTEELRYLTRIGVACAKGQVARAARRVDPADPTTWEFSAFSQNGEDGIVEELLQLVTRPNRYFVEIGASDGLENNVSYLAYVKKYSGLMVEGDAELSARAQKHLQHHNWGVDFQTLMVEPDSASSLREASLDLDPDFLSLDIDGNDWHVLRACLETGLRPKVVCVEYNSTFGPDDAVTIPYQRGFVYQDAHPTQLYYGASVAAWRALLLAHGYRFVTVDTNGVNAFFADPGAVNLPGDGQLRGLAFAENFAQRRRFRTGWPGQRAKLGSVPLVDVDEL